MKYNKLTVEVPTEEDDTMLEFSASVLTPSCSVGVPPSGQLTRERTTNSLFLDE
jgi:hypothetical protein